MSDFKKYRIFYDELENDEEWVGKSIEVIARSKDEAIDNFMFDESYTLDMAYMSIEEIE